MDRANEDLCSSSRSERDNRMSALVSLSQLGFSLAAGGLAKFSPCFFPMLLLEVGGELQLNRLGQAATQ